MIHYLLEGHHLGQHLEDHFHLLEVHHLHLEGHPLEGRHHLDDYRLEGCHSECRCLGNCHLENPCLEYYQGL